MKSVFRVLILLGIFGGGAAAQDNAAMYFYGSPPTVDTVRKLADGASTSVETDGAASRVTVTWPDVTVVIHIDPAWDREVQISGMRGWLSEFPARELKRPEVITFLANLDRTTTAYGSIIEPAYDREGKVAAFLKKLLATSGGYFFSYQSFYTAEGKRIIGLDGDPKELK